MSDAFREGCEKYGITDEMLAWSLERSGIEPQELLSIDTTTSSRNYRVCYLNRAGEKKWVHLLFVQAPSASA
jgi:hypothetical protein